MKLQVILTYLILVLASFESVHQFNLIESIYYGLFVSLILIFINNRKMILLIHLIYLYLITTFALNCNHNFLLFAGLIASQLWYFSTYINKSCYFYDLQLPKKLHCEDFPFFKLNILTLLGKYLFFYNTFLSIYKLYSGSTWTNQWYQIMALIMAFLFCRDYYLALYQKKQCLLLVDKVCNYL